MSTEAWAPSLITLIISVVGSAVYFFQSRDQNYDEYEIVHQQENPDISIIRPNYTSVEWNGPSIEDKCSICYTLASGRIKSLNCKHIFHENCINKWLNSRKTCPICRKVSVND